MPDLTPEAIDDLPEQLRARAFAIQHNAAPETVRLLRAAADALTALRGGAETMREAAAGITRPTSKRPCDCDYCYCQNVGDAEAVAAWDALNAAADAIRALPLPSDTEPDEPGTSTPQPGEASVSSAPAHDPVAEAARALLADDIAISKMAQAIHDGPLGADDEWFSASSPQGAWCIDAVRAALRARARARIEEKIHDRP